MWKSKVEGALPPHLKSWVGTCPHCPHGSYSTAYDVVNTFGQYFANMCGRGNYSDRFLQHEEQLKMLMPDFWDENEEDYNKEFTFRELSEAISRSGSTSVGPDKLHYDLFRHMTDDQLQEILTLLKLNYVWTNDVFPQSWRHSYIIPMLKPGKDCNRVTSYRPKQLTSCLCKLMERIISKRLGWCLEKNGMLSKYQCAFRKERSTMDQLVRLESHIRDGFLHHNTTLAVFLDMKSAYNMVSPTVLLHRLHQLGFRGHMMYFIQSYLQHRTFQVRCGVLSDVLAQEYGLVQGGVLSPLLFNVAIDAMFTGVSRRISYAIYADDCTIWSQGRDLQTLYKDIQQALNEVGRWARMNGFTFSADKSRAVLFRRSLRRVDVGLYPTLRINSNPIPMTGTCEIPGSLAWRQKSEHMWSIRRPRHYRGFHCWNVYQEKRTVQIKQYCFGCIRHLFDLFLNTRLSSLMDPGAI